MEIEIINKNLIEHKIFTFQGKQVMIDRDLAELYKVEVKRLNEQVRRNIERFPIYFRFQLTDIEKNELVANCDRFATLKHSSSNPYAFTEQGVAMLSAVLRSETAIEVSIQIMNAFVEMRKVMISNSGLFQRLETLESKMQLHDKNFEKVFKALESEKPEVKQDIFFQGQIFDAYTFLVNLINKSQNSLVIIDNYVDLEVLEILATKSKGVNVTLITHANTPIKEIDIKKFNAQYGGLNILYSNKYHDRFLIIDQKELYHIGASLKDLGKKCFAFSCIDNKKLLENLMESI